MHARCANGPDHRQITEDKALRKKLDTPRRPAAEAPEVAVDRDAKHLREVAPPVLLLMMMVTAMAMTLKLTMRPAAKQKRPKPMAAGPNALRGPKICTGILYLLFLTLVSNMPLRVRCLNTCHRTIKSTRKGSRVTCKSIACIDKNRNKSSCLRTQPRCKSSTRRVPPCPARPCQVGTWRDT